ncbi:DNA-binding protein [Eubacterium ventriosum]|jgi:sugar-specific transcriptional regulator TrmB|uniref:DNA-binding protein n=1 Tax=Eubacterium ventriosum TaxID=39496 RepID=UPI00399BB657
MNYLMTANDVANELGVSKGHAYKVIRILNEELREKGFVVITGKIPRAFWEKKFYGYTNQKT